MVNLDRPGVGTIGEGLQNTWVLPEEESEDEEKPTMVETGATKAAVPNHGESEMQGKHSAGKGELFIYFSLSVNIFLSIHGELRYYNIVLHHSE